MKVQIYGKNEVGTDYIVGDIPGCFVLLREQLDKIGFDETKDRLFCVGDLVDRGPNNLDVLTWLKHPWFFAVRGNHEQMAIDFGTYDGMDAATYAYNGGGWFLNLDQAGKDAVKAAFIKLPFMMELQTDLGKIGIIHAEVPGDDWATAKELANNRDILGTEFGAFDPFPNIALWARDRIQYNYTVPVNNIDYVVVGHTPRKDRVVLGNVHYIDTGAVFEGKGHFTIINADTLQKAN